MFIEGHKTVCDGKVLYINEAVTQILFLDCLDVVIDFSEYFDSSFFLHPSSRTSYSLIELSSRVGFRFEKHSREEKKANILFWMP